MYYLKIRESRGDSELRGGLISMVSIYVQRENISLYQTVNKNESNIFLTVECFPELAMEIIIEWQVKNSFLVKNLLFNCFGVNTDSIILFIHF